MSVQNSSLGELAAMRAMAGQRQAMGGPPPGGGEPNRLMELGLV